jgi:transposase
MSSKKLDYNRRWALKTYLARYPELAELYYWKEQLHKFYRTRGYHNASRSLKNMIDRMSFSAVKQVRTLRKTLIKWKEEILNYFLTGLTNGRTEGFNNKAKLVKRMAYGYKSFENYRLRLLNACS